MKLSANISYLVARLGVRGAIEAVKSAGFDACDYGFHEVLDHNKLLEDGYVEYYKEMNTRQNEQIAR